MLLKWTAIFFLIAIVAAVFGYSGIADQTAGIAKILFFIFLIMFLVTALINALRGRAP